VQTIKAIVKAPWGEQAQTGPTWYEPLREQAEIDLAVHWVLARRQVFLNTVGDIALIPKVLDAAERFGAAPAEAAMARQLERMKMSNLFVTGWV